MKFWGPGSGLYGRGRWRETPPKPRGRPLRICVIQFGQLGDSILALPALDLLRDHHHDAELTIGCGMPAHELIDMWGRAEKIVPMDRVRVRDTNPIFAGWLICQFVSRIWKPTPDAILVLHPNDEMNLVAYCTLAKRRAGIVVKPGFFARLLNEPFHPLWMKRHASASYVALVRHFCGLPQEDDTPVPNLRLEDAPPRNGRIAIHVGAGRKERRVAPETWLEVARALKEKTRKEIAFVGGPEERGLAQELARGVEGAQVLGGGDIKSLAHELAASGFFIGSDSGPGHLAASVQTPVLTIIEEHKTVRYRTLGNTAAITTRSIRDVPPRDIIEATLAHPSFPRPT